MQIQNSETKGVTVGIIITVTGILMMTVPSVIGLDMMDIGYGLGFIGLVVTITGIVIALLYNQRKKVMDKLLSSKNILARWKYDSSEYTEQVTKEFYERKESNMYWLKIILFFFVIFTALFVIFGFESHDEDEILFFVMMMGGVALIVSFAALFAPYQMRDSALKSGSETLISKKGLYHHGVLHTWNTPLAILKRVSIRENILIFELAYLTKLGWIKYETYNVTIPIPQGEESDAQHIVAVLSK